MLSIERRGGQRFRIGDNVIVTITDPRRGRCKVRIQAPRSVPIDREEILSSETWAEIEAAARGERGNPEAGREAL